PPMIFLTGTFGAVIRIREAFPSKKALFDIGVAGPIAGFVALVPFLYLGLKYSQMLPVPAGDILYFGEPLGLQALAWLRFGTRPEGMDIFLHPMGMAAWFGMLATALNLLPFGQLDGGHIMYALLGKRAASVSALTLLVAVFLTTRSLSWLVFTAMMIFMALTMGLRHPRVLDEDEPVGAGRAAIAIFAVVMFVLCFTPVPVEFLTITPQG
ncbi:MAG TPA: site-2 protease family protein, partial [Vicinamibacterales bacterium]|nr:site-2 protease family protein [Vicinamibacterales bacterium]